MITIWFFESLRRRAARVAWLLSFPLVLLFCSSCQPVAERWGSIPEGIGRPIRVPICGKSNAYQAFQVTNALKAKRMRFDVDCSGGHLIEVGVLRTDNTGNLWAYPGDFRFRVYRSDSLRKEVLFEKVGNFAVNERAGFSIDADKFANPDGAAAIVCELAKASPKKAKGYEAYHDFVFLVPNVFTKRRPDDLNVIIISFDTLRPDHLGCYGYERETSPNIDKLAESGVLFTQAVSTSPWTTPAHYSLFTGLYPSAHQNKRTFAEPFYYDETLAAVLKRNGYYTVAFTGGGSVSSEFGFGNGYNIYEEFSSYNATSSPAGLYNHENDTEKIFQRAMGWLEENSELKFYMFLHTFECHIPYEGTFFLPEVAGATLIEQRKAFYDGDIRVADSYLGEFMNKLEALGLLSNTILVFLSDHGDEFYEHYRESDIVLIESREVIPIPKSEDEIIPQISVVDHAHSLYEELIRIPLILRIPDLDPPKRVLDNQVRIIDIMPTLLDLLDIEYSAPLQGASLVELIETGRRDEDPPALSEFTDIGPERKSIRKDGYKYIRIEDTDKSRYYTFKNLNRHELFDLNADPNEKANIYARKRQLAEEYQTILERELEVSGKIYDVLQTHRKTGERGNGEIAEDVRKNLKALGYLQ